MPRHIEQPAFRHSKPASANTLSRPSASAAALTAIDPGTTIARTPAATFLPRTTSAAARRSGSRPLVHEPMKTRSIATSAIAVPASRPMYSSARASVSSRGSGTRPVIGATWPGFVPQLTWGASAGTSTTTSRSKRAPSSVR